MKWSTSYKKKRKKNDENWDHVFMEIVYQLSRALEWYLQVGVSNGPGPPENPTGPTRPERFWAGLSIFGSGFGSYFWVIFGFGSVSGRASGPIYTLVEPDFFFWKKPYSLRLPQLFASLSSLFIPQTSSLQASLKLCLCVSRINSSTRICFLLSLFVVNLVGYCFVYKL